jgi:hypothetical protein
MKIHQLIGAPSIMITNEENDFIKQHHQDFPIRSLHGREEVVARNLVRKGVYEISNDSEHIVLKKDAKTKPQII